MPGSVHGPACAVHSSLITPGPQQTFPSLHNLYHLNGYDVSSLHPWSLKAVVALEGIETLGTRAVTMAPVA